MANVIDMESGAALQSAVKRELELLERQAQHRKPVPQFRERSTAEVIEALVRQALPAVQRDSAALQRARAENALQRHKAEQERQLELLKQPIEF